MKESLPLILQCHSNFAVCFEVPTRFFSGLTKIDGLPTSSNNNDYEVSILIFSLPMMYGKYYLYHKSHTDQRKPTVCISHFAC